MFFVVLLEMLRKLLQIEIFRGELELFSVGKTKVESHLAIADNVIIFCSATKKSMCKMARVLDKFCSFSRLEMNREKTFIIISDGVSLHQQLASILGLPEQDMPFTQLGIPNTGHAKKKTLIVKRYWVHKRITGDTSEMEREDIVLHWTHPAIAMGIQR